MNANILFATRTRFDRRLVVRADDGRLRLLLDNGGDEGSRGGFWDRRERDLGEAEAASLARAWGYRGEQIAAILSLPPGGRKELERLRGPGGFPLRLAPWDEAYMPLGG